MGVTLKHLQNLNEGPMNIYQLILNTMFGDKLPEFYDPTKEYNKGDSVIDRLEDGSYVLRVVNNYEGTSGDFKEEDWTTTYFTDLFKEGSALDIDFTKIVQIADTEPNDPDDRDNMIWFQPVNLKDEDGHNINISGNAKQGIIIYDNEHFAAQDDQPTEDSVRLWIDYEEETED